MLFWRTTWFSSFPVSSVTETEGSLNAPAICMCTSHRCLICFEHRLIRWLIYALVYITTPLPRRQSSWIWFHWKLVLHVWTDQTSQLYLCLIVYLFVVFFIMCVCLCNMLICICMNIISSLNYELLSVHNNVVQCFLVQCILFSLARFKTSLLCILCFCSA